MLIVGCWNVRKLYSVGALNLLIQELQNFRWDIVGISETHIGQEQVTPRREISESSALEAKGYTELAWGY